MNDRRRSQLTGGLVMVLLGAALLAVQLVPSLKHWIETGIDWANSWALVVVGVGVFLLILGLLLGAPGMAVPACIVGGIGGLLYWQNATGHWETWAYAWALIPGFAGVGTILAGLLGGDARQALRGGGWLVFISLVTFFIFASFLGGPQVFRGYWPVLIIVLGLVLLVRGLVRFRK
jgi:hypothetical protein